MPVLRNAPYDLTYCVRVLLKKSCIPSSLQKRASVIAIQALLLNSEALVSR